MPVDAGRAAVAGVPFGTVLSLPGGEIGYCVLVGLFAFTGTLPRALARREV
ncbi:hypothetical protein Acy02nite_47850 [Actinoplanes cyaneus]|uniref:Uncharacterized protein n=1 Tax=Actinoplanes cyaneus TaxID=52696 RepID=A0A919M8W6_9ACTN|nr:hypothetical protein Acy02nite_47850 [Actinoplanes cyaneus]